MSIHFFCFSISFFTKLFIRMGEIRRTTHHRNHFPVIFNLSSKDLPICLITHFQKSGIPFKPVYIQFRRQAYPFGYRILPSLHNAFIKAFGNTANRGILNFYYFDALIVDVSFGGLRPIKGCCSRSTTWPLIGPLSSASQ